jgi:peptidylprolyl isomerase
LTNAGDKRARKKDFRDQRVAEREAALRRRRNVRLVAILGAVAALVAGALFLSGNDETTTPAADGTPTTGSSPTPAESQPASEAPPAKAACGAKAPKLQDPKSYKAPPKMSLKDGVDYSAVLHTSCGDVTIDLLEKDAPETVNNFVFLAGDGYYDGLAFHRVVANFVIQAGDPNNVNGQPPDGPGYTIPDELPDKANEYIYGVVAMANIGQPDTGGGQFFIVVSDFAKKKAPAGLQPLYSIFGRVDPSSYATVQKIAKLETLGGTDPTQADIPLTPAFIESVEIVEG